MDSMSLHSPIGLMRSGKDFGGSGGNIRDQVAGCLVCSTLTGEGISFIDITHS